MKGTRINPSIEGDADQKRPFLALTRKVPEEQEKASYEEVHHQAQRRSGRTRLPADGIDDLGNSGPKDEMEIGSPHGEDRVQDREAGDREKPSSAVLDDLFRRSFCSTIAVVDGETEAVEPNPPEAIRVT